MGPRYRETCERNLRLHLAPLAASAGATTKDLMLRLGHASPAAAYRYLHAVDGRDAEVAAALSDLAAAHGDAARLPKSIVVKH
jgi:hypothetical protein